MNHPEQIIRTLDSHLASPTRLILYGRAALALGFPEPKPDFNATMDVDAILPELEMTAIEKDTSFWNAIEATNEQLQPSGLYLTHLFTDSQVILRPDWLSHLVAINLRGLCYLRLFRPSTEDLLLTKMMRVDPQDRSDMRFLLAHLQPDERVLGDLFRAAKVPEIPEIEQAFRDNTDWILQLHG